MVPVKSGAVFSVWFNAKEAEVSLWNLFGRSLWGIAQHDLVVLLVFILAGITTAVFWDVFRSADSELISALRCVFGKKLYRCLGRSPRALAIFPVAVVEGAAIAVIHFLAGLGSGIKCLRF